MAKYRCEKCGKEMEEINFYTYKDGSKTELCKKCLTMHIDNYDPETFLWLLEKMDVPYIEPEWNVIREKAYAKDPYGMNGTSVFGKYLSKMEATVSGGTVNGGSKSYNINVKPAKTAAEIKAEEEAAKKKEEERKAQEEANKKN